MLFYINYHKTQAISREKKFYSPSDFIAYTLSLVHF